MVKNPKTVVARIRRDLEYLIGSGDEAVSTDIAKSMQVLSDVLVKPSPSYRAFSCVAGRVRREDEIRLKAKKPYQKVSKKIKIKQKYLRF